ncbi:hypothetical protein C2845_PM06G03170 [Panicum miliaceum]|uniref:Uncharacterized protein n=1 Tax=Panicum miliaceum TaxID=4540 RepID=A0A3L6RDB2_PANMI|nr:hypothetical protein C2845_PM06G03170 [Panicum miliaceum]
MLPEKTGRQRSTRSEGDAFLNGALPCLVDGPGAHEGVFRPEDYYQHWTMAPALKDIIQPCTKAPGRLLDFIVLLLHGLLLAGKYSAISIALHLLMRIKSSIQNRYLKCSRNYLFYGSLTHYALQTFRKWTSAQMFMINLFKMVDMLNSSGPGWIFWSPAELNNERRVADGEHLHRSEQLNPAATFRSAALDETPNRALLHAFKNRLAELGTRRHQHRPSPSQLKALATRTHRSGGRIAEGCRTVRGAQGEPEVAARWVRSGG